MLDESAIRKRAATLLAKYQMESLPERLQRNSLDYYYLSVWPGLRALDDVTQLELPPRPAITRSAYFHLPFCSGLCGFCSYFVVVSKDPDKDDRVANYLKLLLKEVDQYLELTELDLEYVYLGGGTPSIVHPDALAQFLDGLKSRGVLSDELLGTIEVHPELFNDHARAAGLFDVIASFGINRVSFGLQTTDDRILQSTNRRHSPSFLPEAAEMARSRGLSFNLDLMYGLPDTTLDGWLATLRDATEQEPDSISTYFTFIDFGTALWHKVKTGAAQLAAHADLQLQHLSAQIALEDHGYVELPNDFWSKPQEDFHPHQAALPSAANSLGIGAGAYGYFPSVQHFNHFDLTTYSDALSKGDAPLWRATVLTKEQSLRRDVMFSFKNAPELRLCLFDQQYGLNILEFFSDQFDLLSKLDLVEIDSQRICLTGKGRLVVEEIASLFALPTTEGAHKPPSGKEGMLIRKHHFAPTYGDTR